MQWTGDVARGEWIRPRLHGWGHVGGVVPRGFEAYARILHPIRAERDEESATWTWAELASRTGKMMHPLVQSWRFFGERLADLWLEDGWHPGVPDQGFLKPHLLAALTGLLRFYTISPDEVTLGVWVGWGELHPGTGGVFGWFGDGVDQQAAAAEATQRFHREQAQAVSPDIARAAAGLPDGSYDAALVLPAREYVLLTGTLDELADPTWPYRAGIGWRAGGDYGPMPSLMWPADRAWCVATEIDFDSTLVGGSRPLVEAILADPTFEAFEVGPDDDLTLAGDRINPA